MKRGFLFFLITAWATLAHAVIHFVPDDFMNLQEALDESSSNDTIICRNGTYFGPFFIWARNVTIASEYILDPDPGHITNCVIRPQHGDRNHRCFLTQEAISTNTMLRLVGLTIALGRAVTEAESSGGGIYLRNRTAEISHCIFKSNAALKGGAIYADSSIVRIRRTYFEGNSAASRGATFYVKRSEMSLDSCDIGPSAEILPIDAYLGEFHLDAGNVSLCNSLIHDIGQTAPGSRNIFWCFESFSSRQVRLKGCTIENCNLRTLAEGASNVSIFDLRMDSCLVRNNVIWWGFFLPWMNPRMQFASVTRNWFENNSYQPGTGGNGLLFFDQDNRNFLCEENYFLRNNLYSYACLGLRTLSNALLGRAQRNYFVENTSDGYPFDAGITVMLDRVQDSVFEYNALIENEGYGVFSLDWFSPTSYALHNFWGDSTGPYEVTRNPGGLGDTTNAATIYDEWLLSEDEIPDTSLFPPPNAADDRRWTVPSTWFISSIYPNPFNSGFRIELDGMTGADFEVRLYDLLGREVALLHSGRTLRGALSFSAPANLAAGIYFISAHDRFYSETRKVLYLK